MRNILLAVFFLYLLFQTHQASISSKLDDTKTTIPTVVLNSDEKTTTASPHANHVFKHLEDHINSLKHLTKSVADHRNHVIHVPLLFACLETDSNYENCDKINDFM